jgi:hypothetical protein
MEGWRSSRARLKAVKKRKISAGSGTPILRSFGPVSNNYKKLILHCLILHKIQLLHFMSYGSGFEPEVLCFSEL